MVSFEMLTSGEVSLAKPLLEKDTRGICLLTLYIIVFQNLVIQNLSVFLTILLGFMAFLGDGIDPY